MNSESRWSLLPHQYAPGIADISLDALAEAGILGIIVDLDNTLVAYHESVLAPPVAAWIEAARARGMALVLVSNNFEERVAAVGAHLGIPVVSSAMKPLPNAFLRALRMLGTSRKATVVVGDQLFTDVVGARLAGLRAILTEPISERGFVTTRALRVLERFVLRLAGVRR